jgi:hypothetical protein
MTVAINYPRRRRRRWMKYTVWIIMVISTLLLVHNRMMESSKPWKEISNYIIGGNDFGDQSFEAPQIPTSKKTPSVVRLSSSTESRISTKRPLPFVSQGIMNTRLFNVSKIETTATSANAAHSTTTQNRTVSFSTNSTSSTTTPFSIQEECFPFNSNRWIQGRKDSNNDQSLTPELIETLLEAPRHFQKLSALFRQTICHDHSPLKNLQQQQQQQQQASSYTTSLYMQQGAEEWYQRFFYLAMHWKFHQPALSEYQRRKDCWNNATLYSPTKQQQQQLLLDFQANHGIGNFDFECPESKFIVSPVGHIGFGAFINTQVCMTILIAIRTGRIPIFTIQSLYPWQKGDTDPWLLAPTHCARKDLQCYYMSMTPCALLIEDIRNATRYGLTRSEQRWLRKNQDIPEKLKHDRVVAINSGLQSKGKEMIEIRTIAANIVQELFEEWIKQQTESNQQWWSKEEWEAMNLAKQWMVEKTEDDPTGLLRQMYVYFLRLNPHYQSVLTDRMSALLPTDLNPFNTVGVAIRGSDKCKKESTCLTFPRYMDLVTDVVYPSFNQTFDKEKPKLIMTTEDPTIFNESLPYQQNASFQYQFLVNDQDNMQGSGFPKDFRDQGENTIVSTMTALLLHLSPGRVYLNCCSNFHTVIRNLITAQCGANRHGNWFPYNQLLLNGTVSDKHLPLVPTVAHCLSEEGVVPRKFRICCGWYDKKDSTCNEIWQDHLQNHKSFSEKRW